MGLNTSLQIMILITTLICILVNFKKHSTKQVWLEYKNPVAFYKKLIQKQVELGVMNEAAVTENFAVRHVNIFTVFSDKDFLFELFILLLIPYPF